MIGQTGLKIKGTPKRPKYLTNYKVANNLQKKPEGYPV
jgi:hypothetical protein